MTSLDSIIDQYDRNPRSITLDDIFVLIRFLLAQQVTLPDACRHALTHSGEPPLPDHITGIYLVRPQNAATRDTAIITVGVHGNEIFCGGLCVLEVLSQQRAGTLSGPVIIQLGNIKAIQGYMAVYDPLVYFLERNGWRETNGIEREVITLRLHDDRRVEVMSDFNRLPRDVMHLPRGLHPNVDRAQALIWLYRAFLKGFIIDDHNALLTGETPYQIQCALHPHTSRMVGGIRNLYMPSAAIQAFKDGAFRDKLRGIPEEMRILMWWTGDGLGGKNNILLDQHIEGEHLAHHPDPSALPLILTLEFGQHEDFRPDDVPSLCDMCGPATRTILGNCGLLGPDHPAPADTEIEIVYADPVQLDISYFKGSSKIKKGDAVYLVCEADTVQANAAYLQAHFHFSIIIDEDGTCTRVQTKTLTGKEKGRVFYCMPRLELDDVHGGQIVLLAFGEDRKAKFLTAPHDMIAVFTGDARLEFPIYSWDLEHDRQKIFYAGEV